MKETIDRSQLACVRDRSAFYPNRMTTNGRISQAARAAIEMCGECPVGQAQCLAEYLQASKDGPIAQDSGIVAGTTPEQRKPLLLQMRSRK